MKHSRNQVLFNFMGDPYCKANDEYRITRKALEIFLENRIPVAILTKGGTRLLQDIDIIKKFEDHIMVGATITTMDEELSKEWEPGAASPQDRVEMLEKVKDQGIKTWASFEPVIDTRHAIDAIEKTLHCVDVYKVGKMNNFRTAEKNPDWQAFLDSVVAKLRKAEKPLYIKHDLRIAGQKTKLYGNEVLPDEFCAQPW